MNYKNHYNSVNQKYWKLETAVCIDDDLDKCESRSREKTHISRKA